MSERIIVDGKGTERPVARLEGTVFENKHTPIVDEKAVLRHLQESRRLYKEMQIGQRSAEVTVNPQRPDLPIFVWMLCDSHLGSTYVDYEKFIKDYEVVMNTPNFYVISNGDEVDNFMANMGKSSDGVYTNPITPAQQARLMRKMWGDLDDKGKILAMTFGNHNEWLKGSGMTFEETWLDGFQCPILNCGGLLTLHVGEQTYRIATTHKYWGSSKLNPNNASRRYLEHEYPGADIVFLGHTHQKAIEQFDRAGKSRLGIIGGTYKIDDEWAAQAGIGGRGCLGGTTVALYPDERKMIPLYYVKDGLEFYHVKKNLAEMLTRQE